MSTPPVPLEPVSCATVLRALAVEAVRAGEQCERLGDLVARLVRTCEGEELKIAMQEAQAVDSLIQHLAALAAFAGRLSEQAQCAGKLEAADALKAVPLADLAARLTAVLREEDGPSMASAGAGDLDLF